MTISQKFIRRLAQIAFLSFIALGTANAQSLHVPMPIEEKGELENAILRSKNQEQFSSGAPILRQGIPLGRDSVARNQHQETRYQQQSPTLQTLTPNTAGYTVKAGAFKSFENAQKLYAKLYDIGNANIIPRRANGQDFYGVYLGPWATEAEAFQAYTLAMDAGMQDGKILDPSESILSAND